MNRPDARTEGYPAFLPAEGLRFQCTKGGDCCRGTPGQVFVNEREIEAIAGFLKLDQSEFLHRCCRPVLRGHSLRETPDGRCIFLTSDNACSIQAVKPTQCKTWPFWFENLRSEAAWRKACQACKGLGQGACIPPEEILKTVQQDLARE